MPKRAQYHRIESHAVYAAEEIVTRFRTSHATIKRLAQDYGLPIYAERSTALVHGADLKAAFAAFYETPPQKPHEAYCLRCKTSRRMRLDSLDVVRQTETNARVTGLCERCGGGMNRAMNIAQVDAFKTALKRSYNAVVTHCPPEGGGSDRPRSQCNLVFPSRSPANMRVRRSYLRHLRGGRGFSAGTVAVYLIALDEYDAYTGYRDYKTFTIEDAEGFRAHLRETVSRRTGKPLSLQSIRQKLGAVQAFFVWLSCQEGYKRAITVGKYEQLSLSRRELAISRVREPREAPTLEEVEQVLESMAARTPIERRDRALVAFLTITGTRVQALIGLQLRHVNLARRIVRQDPRDVHTKFGKEIITSFFPVNETAEEIFAEYVVWLRGEMGFKPTDPLFPCSKRVGKLGRSFAYDGLDPRRWKCSGAVRRIVNRAFEQVGCPAYGPHAFRHMIVQEGNRIAKTPEELKAWSQNLGHADVRTTQSAYGTLTKEQQAQVIDRMRGREGELSS